MGALRKEEQALEAELNAELAANPTWQKLSNLRALIRRYTGPQTPAPRQEVRQGVLEVNGSEVKPTSRKGRIRIGTAAVIANGNGKAKRSDILAHLMKQGILPNDKKQAIRILAPILSEATEFETDGTGFWSLAAGSEYSEACRNSSARVRRGLNM